MRYRQMGACRAQVLLTPSIPPRMLLWIPEALLLPCPACPELAEGSLSKERKLCLRIPELQ
jgi:hypothetical protein